MALFYRQLTFMQGERVPSAMASSRWETTALNVAAAFALLRRLEQLLLPTAFFLLRLFLP